MMAASGLTLRPIQSSLAYLQEEIDKRPRINPDKVYWGLVLEHKGDGAMGGGSTNWLSEGHAGLTILGKQTG